MRLISILITLFATVALSSCLTIEEKLTMNRDGSGVYTTSVDMSKMFNNPMMVAAMEKEIEKGDEAVMRKDSVIDFYGLLEPVNPQWTEEDKALLKKVEGRFLMDIEKKEGGMFVTYPFENTDQLMYIMDLFMNANRPEGEDSEDPLDGFAGGNLSTMTNVFTWSAGKFSRQSSYNKDAFASLAGEEEGIVDMMKMMFSDAKVVYLMEFPGKVKKVKGFTGHEIVDNNTVRLEFDFLDFLEDASPIDAALDGNVKYKK